MEKIWKFLDAFFPLRLVLAHFKYNIIAYVYWFILFGIVSGSIASNYGVPYLFLSPEYNGTVSWVSFLFMGIGFGGFTIAFNIYSYKIMGKVYPFVSTLSRPFNKFFINNSALTLVFCVYYIVKVSIFQYKEEMASPWNIFLFDVSFLFGFLAYLFLSFLYFFPTNKDYGKLTGDKSGISGEEPIGSYFHKEEKWQPTTSQDKKRYIYFNTLFSVKLSRSVSHYDKLMMNKVFSQNYLNATLFEIVTLIAFFLLGLFKEIPLLQLPAGMSIILLMTVILMMFSILVSWFGNWAYPIIIIIFFSLNILSGKSAIFRYDTYIYGVNYETKNLRHYSWKSIKYNAEDTLKNRKSLENAALILANWKAKTNEKKPKLIITMTSGGGLRSSMWVFEVMNYLDSISDNRYNQNLQMITGASGGMIGAAYYRSLLLEKAINPDFSWNYPAFSKNISSDLLNTLSLSASVNDLFFRFSKFTYNEQKYSKDRGYAFEYQLNKNTGNIFEHPLSYYGQYEQSATIPLMIFSPTIANDGRRLLISSQSLNYLTNNASIPNATKSYETIDYQTFFRKNNVGNTRFSTVLRMNATFPMILPMTTLPTSPEVEVMDAGLRDNYGAKVTLEYLFKLQNWIKENTSGVIIVQIRDTKKQLVDEHTRRFSLIDKILTPFNVTVKNIMKTQDYDIDEMTEFLHTCLDFPIDLVCFDLKESQKTRISLSWHLTKNEKKFIKSALHTNSNQSQFAYFMQLIGAKN
ncbi:MAG TPA: hypothetical protein PLP27_07465 [Crocinitomicaceae bacterium]|nr:hypothetical protein [Crocinitomicaceae bacterium]